MNPTLLATLGQASNTFVVYQGWAVGWGTLALINAGLAQGKGHRGLVWFLVSLLAGPLATLMIVLIPRVATKP